ncbi:MAG: RNA polymerase factor sigma-54 [Verrucomicrobiales bacterium]|jgi:RNA polymerase sigma-54 factor|nr:RNA polymerase factor sigma-54 [Verrucomicrobiales bacterium]
MVGLGLQQNFSLAQTLSPQMQQSLQFLQAPALELRALIQRELQSNPVLEEQEPEPEARREDADHDAESEPPKKQDEDWREYFSQSQPSKAASSELQKKRDFFFDSQVAAETLSAHLRQQLTLDTANQTLLMVGEEIIGNLNENGFLTLPLEEIANRAGVDLPTAEQALTLIQSCHPPGVGARDLRESLLIQLRHQGVADPLITTLTTEELDKIGRKRFSELARRYQTTPERIREIAETISGLNPRPGAAFAADQPQHIVQAEANFVKQGDTWVAQLNREPLPSLRISDTYKDLLGDTGRDQDLKEYLRERLRAGKFLIKCLHQRQQTIENVLNEIARRQTDFLEHGVSHLQPLTMNQVAAAVGVHETTVSRAAANKYVATPWGVFPIKYFFTSGYTTSDGQNLANTSVKDAIADLVSREDNRQPLSDSEIVSILEEKGIELARRTVAKYRAELNILPSNLRRQP